MSMLSSPAVVALFTAPRAGAEMESHTSIYVVAGVGIPGDRYATRLGHWSDPRWKDQELSLVGVELLAELGLQHSALRRNIVTRGIDLLDLIGLEFTIGTARLVGKRQCSPCNYIEGLTRPGLFGELRGRGGLRAAILNDGHIRVGDELHIVGVAEP
ncbi:MAG TPA: MOSC domain-containing protein [Tepidiformaceae bacterium]|nr:MOSC domain-containing protein [Tepidiformaceae bacterium]